MFQFKLYAKYADNSWLFEFVSIMLSCGLMVGLCDILAVYNERDVPTFGVLEDWGLTLNTVVSILANVSVFSATAAVTSCIGQLKWLSFAQSSRSLGDFETYDEASRGFMGSIQLIWKLRLSCTASLGALLVVVQLVMGPLAQQSVQTAIRAVPLSEGRASIPRAKNWNRLLEGPISNRFPSNINYSIPLGMKGAILGGLITNSDLTINNTDPSCSSGNCTFSDYSSLAICSEAVDVTAHIKDYTSKQNGTRKICIPDDHCLHLDNDLVKANITSAAPDSEFYRELDPSDGLSLGELSFTSVAFQNRTSRIADGFVIYQKEDTAGGDYEFSAVEFMLEWCIPTFKTNVTNGTATTTLEPRPLNDFATDTYSGRLSRTALEGVLYTVDLRAHYALQRYMGVLLSGAIILNGQDEKARQISDNSDEALVIARALGVPGLNREDYDPESGIETFRTVLRNVATSMTNYIRAESIDSIHTGTVYIQRSFVAVRWGWVVAPVAFVALSTIFFISVVVKGGQHRSIGLPLWKSNSMAALRILDTPLRSAIGPLELVSSLEDEQTQLCARLVRDDDGWALTQEKASNNHGFVPLSSEEPCLDEAASGVTSLTLRVSEDDVSITSRPMKNDSNSDTITKRPTAMRRKSI